MSETTWFFLVVWFFLIGLGYRIKDKIILGIAGVVGIFLMLEVLEDSDLIGFSILAFSIYLLYYALFLEPN